MSQIQIYYTELVTPDNQTVILPNGNLANNSQVLVLGEESGWYQVLYLGSGGQAATGYVSGDYLLVTP